MRYTVIWYDTIKALGKANSNLLYLQFLKLMGRFMAQDEFSLPQGQCSIVYLTCYWFSDGREETGGQHGQVIFIWTKTKTTEVLGKSKEHSFTHSFIQFFIYITKYFDALSENSSIFCVNHFLTLFMCCDQNASSKMYAVWQRIKM